MLPFLKLRMPGRRRTKLQITLDQPPRRGRSLSRTGYRAFAPSMIHVDELFRLGDVVDDVEFVNEFFFRNLKCDFRRLKVFAFGGIFCPQAISGEIFQLFRVFD